MNEQGIKSGADSEAPFREPPPGAPPLAVESWATFARSLGLNAPRPSPAVKARSFLVTYLSAAAAVFFLVCASVFAVNVLVDPLWYLGGNKIFPRNYPFNERVAKTNLFLAAGPASFDCLVFGSSRATMLDATRIRGHRCFNYSFSAGDVREFIAFARYAQAAGANPRLLIVNVDAESFDDRPSRPLNIPPFIAAGHPPPSVVASYLSYDALGFSIATLIGHTLGARYYDRQLLGDVLPGMNGYRFREHVVASMTGTTYSGAAAADFAALRAVFPAARGIGFVAPVSGAVVAMRRAEGSLEGLLDAHYGATAVFDAMYDFSVPSATTADSRHYYDDSHFHRYVYDIVGDVLNGERADFGLDVGTLSRADYGRAYELGLRRLERRNE